MLQQRPKAVLLIRVSDQRQEREGLSLDNQEQVLCEYAETNAIDIVAKFRFQESADLKIRKRFREMIEFIQDRPDVSCLIGYRVDRMTRNFHDHVLLDELRLNQQKELHFVHDRLVIGPRTVGKDIQDWDTKVYLAKMYLNRLKEDAVISAAFKVSRGEWPGKAPFGYRNVRRNERNTIEVHPREAEVVQFVFRQYASGLVSMNQVRSLVLEQFGIDISKGQLDWMLKNPFYYGEMRFNGSHHAHVYEPLIPHDLFERATDVSSSFQKKPHRFAGLDFAYRGLIRCAECGCAITPERKRKSDGKTYHYYHCTQYFGRHGAAWLTEEALTEQFAVVFDGLHIPDDQLAQMVKSLKESHADKLDFSSTVRTRLLTDRTRLSNRLKVLYEDRLDDVIPKEVYAAKKVETESEIKQLDRKLEGIDEADSEYYLNACRILELCSDASAGFRNGSSQERRAIISLVFQNCELNEKTLLWKLKSPFDAVFSHAKLQEWLPLLNMFRNKSLDLELNLFEMKSELESLGPCQRCAA